jgi:hypothetical protein
VNGDEGSGMVRSDEGTLSAGSGVTARVVIVSGII